MGQGTRWEKEEAGILEKSVLTSELNFKETLLQAYVRASLGAYYKNPSHIHIMLGGHGQYLKVFRQFQTHCFSATTGC
jgi:hypothetical protein